MSVAAATEAGVVQGALAAITGVAPQAERQSDGTYVVFYKDSEAATVRAKMKSLLSAMGKKDGKSPTTPNVKYRFGNVYLPVLLSAMKWYLIGSVAIGAIGGYAFYKYGEKKGRKAIR